jgi:hypothetical protein
MLPALVSGQNLGGGLVLGMNLSQIDGDNEGGFRKPGAALGGYVTFMATEKLEIQPEIIWDQIGSVSKEGFFSNRFNYFSFPVIVNFQIPILLGEEMRILKLQAGPVPSVLMNAKDKLIASPNDDITANYKSLDIRAAVGAVFELKPALAFSVRWNYSMFPFAKGTSNRFPLGGPWHEYLQLSLRLALVDNR